MAEALKVFFFTCLATYWAVLLIFFLVGLPLTIASILIGAKYKDECPVENMIPIYLIVLGTVLLLFTCCRYQSYNRDERQGQSVSPLLLVMDLFTFAWFICGLEWIYRAYEPNYDDPKSADYCNMTLYQFVFWLGNSYLILSGICLLIMCLTYTLIALFGNAFGSVPKYWTVV